MSDLTATNCGCGCENGNGMSSCLWIILLLACCGGCGNMNSGCGNGCGNDSCLWIIRLLLFCGGNSFGGGCGSNCGCGCSSEFHLCLKKMRGLFRASFPVSVYILFNPFSYLYLPSLFCSHCCLLSPRHFLPIFVSTYTVHQSHTLHSHR